LVTYYADIARNYVQIRTLQQQLQYAHQNVEIQRRALDLAQRRVQGGISTNLDQFQAESNLATTESQIPQLEVQLHQTLNRLAVLTGSFPGSLHEALAHPAPIPTIPSALPQDVPCDVVRQRPDIRQAERAIAAATADVGVATGDLYPRFSIGNSLGWSSQKFSNLFFNNDSFQFNLGPSIRWALFQSGRIRCNINSTEWAVSEALATYEQTLLRAFEEIENARVGFTKERERYHHLQVTVEAAEKSLQSVLALYKNGNTDFQNVLDTQRTLFEAQNALAISEGQIVTQLINIYRALGGGWDPNHHCPGRCVRLGFTGRIDAKIVEAIPVDDQSSTYYGAPIEQPVQPTPTNTPIPPARPDPLPPTNFRQELERLRETIDGTAQVPGVSAYSPAPPNGNY
ncbi:MAG: TolC family protein, partial [Planctomycetota bacterium]